MSKAVSGATACGCFGVVNVSPWLSASFSLFSVAVLTRCAAPAERTDVPRHLRVAVLLVVCCIVISVAGVLMAHPRFTTLAVQSDLQANEIVVLEPDQWIGQRCPLLQYCDDERLATGDWVVLLYKRDCEICERLLSRVEQSSANVAVLEIPHRGSAKAVTLERPDLISCRLTDQYRWFVEGPAAIGLHDGKCVAAD